MRYTWAGLTEERSSRSLRKTEARTAETRHGFLRLGETLSFKRIITEADEVRTPDILLAEISRKYLKADSSRLKSRLETIASASLVTPVGVEIAMKAGEAYLELAEKAARQRRTTPSLYDAIVLATARVYDSKVPTGDEHFEGLPETIAV